MPDGRYFDPDGSPLQLPGDCNAGRASGDDEWEVWEEQRTKDLVRFLDEIEKGEIMNGEIGAKDTDLGFESTANEPREFLFGNWGIKRVANALGLSHLLVQHITIDIKSGEFSTLRIQTGIRNEQIDSVLEELGDVVPMEVAKS